MGKSAPAPPPAPDYQAAASATAAGNLQYAQYTTAANRPDVTTPWGTESWTDPSATGGTPEETIGLTPAEQAALNSQQTIQQNESGLATTLQGQAQSTMANGFQAPSLSSYTDAVSPLNENYSAFNPGAAGVGSVNTAAPQFNQNTANAGIQAAYNSEMGLVQPEEQQQTTSTQNQLALQGLTPGTEAYNNAMQTLNSSQNQENTTIANNAVETGTQEASTDYQNALAGYGAGNTAQQQQYTEGLDQYDTGQQALTSQAALQNQQFGQALTGYDTAYTAAQNNYLEPLNAMNAVLTGQQVSSPSFPNFATQAQTAGPNDLGAAEDQSSYNQGIYNTEASSASQGLGSLEGLAGDAAMIMAFA